MINTLHIRNIGIIDDITINLNEGFNVLTGETGAGKTLIIGSLQILAGERFSKDMIKKGENFSFVEMSCYIPNMGFEDDTVIISREINLSGRNTCKINGRLVTVSELKNFMSKIVDIHGQNENQSILDESTHIELLDDFARNDIESLKEEYNLKYKEYLNLKEEIQKNYGDEREKQRKLDLLNYQVNEIEDASLKENEEEELEERKRLISSSEKISNSLNQTEEILGNDIVDNLSVALKSMEKIETLGDNYLKIVERLRNSYYELEEVFHDVNEETLNLNFDEEELNSIEERLDLINNLKRKYGSSIKEILTYKEEINKEIFEIENLDEYVNSLKKKLKELINQMYEISSKMHSVREKFAEILSQMINNELVDLEMSNSKFSINVNFDIENKFNKNGLDNVEFMISTNIGEEPKKLIKIASGGEMSRFMLAVKSVLSEVDKMPIMVFDEIDTGISGKAANATGEKMKNISKNHQVICVTHLATIAAKGNSNYYIYKEVDNGKTYTRVKHLNEKETLEEIARISSGNITDISLKHAKELRNGKLKIA